MKYTYRILFLFLCLCLGAASCRDDGNEPAAASLELDSDYLSFPGYRSTLAVKVDATRRWRAVPSDYWITVDPDGYPSDGQHFVANVAVTVSDNTGDAPRTGSVTFYIGDDALATLTVDQEIRSEEELPEEESPVTWANLQWTASLIVAEGTAFEAGCCVFADGITNTMESTTGEGITCEIGYSTEDSKPDGEEWVWIPCWFNGDWGNNFYYQGKIEGLGAGIYYYTFRIRQEEGPYVYAGTNGLWDGQENVNGSFEVTSGSGGGDIDYSQYSISWANIQWTVATTIHAGEQFEAGSKVKVDGLTNREEPSADGMGIVCEIGYGGTSDPTDGAWLWTECPFNADWGDEFYYQGRTPAIGDAGSYYFAFRYKLGPDGTWVYAGSDGLWDGTVNTSGTFVVE